ncbi:MAG: Nif-specific regulatory protein [Bradymonadia bacterium]|jgi:Nif-specific regulatory protein
MSSRVSSRADAEIELFALVASALNELSEPRQIVSTVLQMTVDQSQLRRATVLLRDPSTDEIFIDDAYGLSMTQQFRGRYKLGEGITGRVVAAGKPEIVDRVSKSRDFLNRTGARKIRRANDLSFVCVPLFSGGDVIGALSADRAYQPGHDLQKDVRLLQILGTLMAQGVELRRVKSLIEERRRAEEDRVPAPTTQFKPDNIIGKSKEMRGVYAFVEQVASTPTTVLILGESGTGKELVAAAIHGNSARTSQPFIRVNCGALPESIVESELFGHEKGAFTGATQLRKGRFELANGGTIFLDEVGELTPATQVKLLRVLQEREFERVGGTRTVKVDVRVMAATSQDLEALIETGTFRLDLFYRLNVFPIIMPPLRERTGDVTMLADYFVESYNKTHGKNVRRIATSALDLLTAYHWPGNVRELENCIERAVLLSADDVIHGHQLPPSLQTAEATGTRLTGGLLTQLDNVERTLILDALKSTRGNITAAARLLDVTERVMGLRVSKHAIDPRRFKRQ